MGREGKISCFFRAEENKMSVDDETSDETMCACVHGCVCVSFTGGQYQTGGPYAGGVQKLPGQFVSSTRAQQHI